MATPEEVKEVLHHLLLKLQDPESRHYRRYSSWIKRHPEIEEFIFGRLKHDFLHYLERDGRSMNGTRLIGGDLSFQGRAIYLHSIAGLDGKTRVYVGQSSQLSTRLWKQHHNFRYRRDNRSLHYHAVQNSTFDVFAVCATLPANISSEAPGMDQPQLAMNILEMYCSLLLRSLPRKILLEYLPPGAKVPMGPPDGLNVASPLDHGLQYRLSEWVDLSESQDPLVLEYIGQARKEPVKKTKKVVRERVEESWLTPQLLVFGAVAIAGILILRNPTVRTTIRKAFA